MICPNCGAEIEENFNQCPVCDYRINDIDDEKTQQEEEGKSFDSSTQNQQAVYKTKNNAPLIIVSVICAILIIIVCIMGFILLNEKENSETNSIASESGISHTEENSSESAAEIESEYNIENSSAAETSTTTAPVSETTTTTTTTTTAEQTTTTTTAATTTIKEEPKIYANDLISISKSRLVDSYLNGIFDTDYISAGQYNVVSLKNTSVFPYYKFGFNYMSVDEINNSDTPEVIHITEGGQLNDKIKVGMTYNELKELCDFDGASFDGGTYGATAWVNIDGVKWGIEFNLSAQDKADLGVLDGLTFDMIGVPYDLSDINPTSDLAYYIKSIQ